MPIVRTEEIKTLLKHAMTKYEEVHQTKFEENISESFQEMAQEINQNYRLDLKGDTIYKNMYLRVRRHQGEHINYNKRYLDGIAKYVHKKNYKEIYSLIYKSPPPTNENTSNFSHSSLHPQRQPFYIYFHIHQERIAKQLFNSLNQHHNAQTVLKDTSLTPLENFYRKLTSDTIVIEIIDETYLKSEHCMKELISIYKDRALWVKYIRQSIRVVVDQQESDSSRSGRSSDIFSTAGKATILTYWREKKIEIDKIIDRLGPNYLENFSEKFERDVSNLEEIREKSYPMLSELVESFGTVKYENVVTNNYGNLIEIFQEKLKLLRSQSTIHSESTSTEPSKITQSSFHDVNSLSESFEENPSILSYW